MSVTRRSFNCRDQQWQARKEVMYVEASAKHYLRKAVHWLIWHIVIIRATTPCDCYTASICRVAVSQAANYEEVGGKETVNVGCEWPIRVKHVEEEDGAQRGQWESARYDIHVELHHSLLTLNEAKQVQENASNTCRHFNQDGGEKTWQTWKTFLMRWQLAMLEIKLMSTHFKLYRKYKCNKVKFLWLHKVGILSLTTWVSGPKSCTLAVTMSIPPVQRNLSFFTNMSPWTKSTFTL